MNYILISPCRNEEKNLHNLAQSITSQTIKPLLWVIVDDRSADGTKSIIKNLEQKYDWIYGSYLAESGDYMGLNYSRVCREGFDFALSQCLKNNLYYDFIALIDADNIPEKNYFEKLISEFMINPDLGIASGINAFIDIDSTLKEMKIDNVMDERLWNIFKSKNLETETSRSDIPMGSARIWRKKCFFETGGYLVTHSPDSVSNIKAKMMGWKTKRIASARVLERVGLVTLGSWKGYKKRGISDYYIWYPLPLAILKALAWSTRKPFYTGMAYLFGYLISFIKSDKRLEDVDIKEYNKKIRYKELITYYNVKFKTLTGL